MAPKSSSKQQQPPAKKQKRELENLSTTQLAAASTKMQNTGPAKQHTLHAAASKTQRYPTIKFSGSAQQNIYAVLSKRKVLSNKYIDLSALEVLGIQDDLVQSLKVIGWSGLMSMDDPSYEKLTYEFLSSFTVNDDALSFRIANVQHEITKSALADMFGWQLVEAQPLPEGYATPFWQALTRLPKSASYGTDCAFSS